MLAGAPQPFAECQLAGTLLLGLCWFKNGFCNKKIIMVVVYLLWVPPQQTHLHAAVLAVAFVGDSSQIVTPLIGHHSMCRCGWSSQAHA